jgi:hypothetical protein
MIYHDILVDTFWAGVVVFLLFSFVILFGAPFLPTLRRQVPKAIELIDLKPGQTLLELGGGDGRVAIAAAQTGINVICFELNPLLVVYSWLRTRRYGKRIKIIWGNYWRRPLPPSDGIFVFLLKPYMSRLNNKIIQEIGRPVKLVSFAYSIPNRSPDGEHDGLYLYKYGFKTDQ